MLERVGVGDLRLLPLAHRAVLESGEDDVVPEVDLGVLAPLAALRRIVAALGDIVVVASLLFVEGLSIISTLLSRDFAIIITVPIYE